MDLYAQLLDCHQRISPLVHDTPVLSSSLINELVGANIVFKCENFQKGGAFKIRGALNAIQLLSPQKKSCGVVTHSSGNFAQAVALASRQLGLKNYIVMPSSASAVKIAAVNGYGGNVIECGATVLDRESTAAQISEETGATFLHPSNNLNVIIGQGTATFELLRDVPDLDACFCPVGGGGLAAGACVAADGKYRVFGSEPFEADDAYRSMQSGSIESNASTNTIADGLKTQLGDINFPIIREHLEAIIRVTEVEIIDAMKLVWTRMKLVIEPSSAVAVAAVIRESTKWRSKKVGIVISGGNVDLENLPFAIPRLKREAHKSTPLPE